MRTAATARVMTFFAFTTASPLTCGSLRGDGSRPDRNAFGVHVLKRHITRSGKSGHSKVTSFPRLGTVMTTTVEPRFVHRWEQWHVARERELADPHGWLALVSLDWLDETP